jgi:uncharacterized protein involved in exopolysaccharide biosynthesis
VGAGAARRARASGDLTLRVAADPCLRGPLGVEPVHNARLVRSASSSYPVGRARANTLAEAFIAQNLDQKVEATRYATQFLAKQMEEARAKLEAAEVSLNHFVERNDILFLGSPDKVGDREDLVTKQLAVLSDALLKARTSGSRRSLVQQAKSQGRTLPCADPLIAKLKELVTARASTGSSAKRSSPSTRGCSGWSRAPPRSSGS